MQTTTSVHWNKGNVSERHNQREETLCKNEDHIDLQNEHGDSCYASWYHSDLRNKYLEVFGDAIAKYNEKQKRKDRKITVDSYMESVLNDTRGKRQTKIVNGKRVVDEYSRQGKQLSYEITVKVGNTYREKDDKGRVVYDSDNHHVRKEELPRDLQCIILKKYCDSFQEENPNFRLVNIDFHADEGFYNRKGVWEYSTEHSHIEFIPIVDNFKQGLSVQNSMNKALKAMGFQGSNCYDAWAKKEQERLEKITQEEYENYCKDNPDFYAEQGDLTIYHPVTDKTLQGDKTKEQIAQEQELDEAISEAESAMEAFQEGCETNDSLKDDLQAQIDAQKVIKDNLQVELLNAQNAKNTALQTQTEYTQKKADLQKSYTDELNALQKDYDNKKEEFQKKEDALDAQKKALDDKKASLDLQKEKLDAEKIALKEKQKELEKALAICTKATTYNEEHAKCTSFEEWAKTKVYKVPEIQLKSVMNKDGTGHDFQKIYVRDEKGHIKYREVTPYSDYQSEMKRKQSYQFNEDENKTIKKARGYEFDL